MFISTNMLCITELIHVFWFAISNVDRILFHFSWPYSLWQVLFLSAVSLYVCCLWSRSLNPFQSLSFALSLFLSLCFSFSMSVCQFLCHGPLFCRFIFISFLPFSSIAKRNSEIDLKKRKRNSSGICKSSISVVDDYSNITDSHQKVTRNITTFQAWMYKKHGSIRNQKKK